MINNAALRAPVAISLGAIAGALSRYYLGTWLIQATALTNFPIGTLGVNLLGCFLMGLLVSLPLKESPASTELRLLLATGFLGSLTTFSAYELDTANLLNTPGWRQDVVYWLGTPLLGWLSLKVGLYLMKTLSRATGLSD